MHSLLETMLDLQLARGSGQLSRACCSGDWMAALIDILLRSMPHFQLALVQVRHPIPGSSGLLHMRIHVTASWRVLGWEAVVWGWPWLQGQGCFPSRLTPHFLAVILLQAHLMVLRTSSHTGMGQGEVPVTVAPARFLLLGQPICAVGLVLLLLLLLLLQRPHTPGSILVGLILACRILPWETGVGLWVSGPEDESVADLSGWGLQAHGFQRTRGMPPAGVGPHRVWVPTRLPRLHCRWVPGLLLAGPLPHLGVLHPRGFLQSRGVPTLGVSPQNLVHSSVELQAGGGAFTVQGTPRWNA